MSRSSLGTTSPKSTSRPYGPAMLHSLSFAPARLPARDRKAASDPTVPDVRWRYEAYRRRLPALIAVLHWPRPVAGVRFRSHSALFVVIFSRSPPDARVEPKGASPELPPLLASGMDTFTCKQRSFVAGPILIVPVFLTGGFGHGIAAAIIF